MRLSLWPLLLAATLAAAHPGRRRQLHNCVAHVLGDDAAERIVTPEDATYTDARIGETIQFDQLPLLIAYAAKAEEVGPLVRCAKHAGIKAVPRTGGHHFLAYSALTGTLVIDITHIDYVHVSADKASAKVGAGIRLGAIYTALSLHGLDWPGGLCPTVGLSGFLSAGGFNMQMRELGLAVDHVLAAQVVTADGRTVDASPDFNADLFWAIRGGGGGSYGIVVEWTLKLSAFPRSSMISLKWNEPDTRAQVASRFLEWAPKTDPALMNNINVYKNRTDIIGWCLGCELEHAQALIRDSGLLEIGEPDVIISGGCNTVNSRIFGYVINECVDDAVAAQYAPYASNYVQQPYTQIGNYPQFAWNETAQDPSAPLAQPWARFIRIAKSYFLQKDKQLSEDVVQKIVDKMSELPDEAAIWGEWHAWNVSGSADQAAFAWRDQAYAHLEFIIQGSDDQNKQKGYRKWADELEDYLRPIAGPASYAGYMDDTISTDPLESYYGDNIHRLSQIKRKYDRNDFFDNPLGIPVGRGRWH